METIVVPCKIKGTWYIYHVKRTTAIDLLLDLS